MKQTQKQIDMEFIKRVASISVINACKRVGVNKSNMYADRVSEEQIHKVAEELRYELADVYFKYQSKKDKAKKEAE